MPRLPPPIETRFKSGEQAAKAGAKGGSVISLKKKYAAQFRELRKKGATSQEVNDFIARIDDRAAAAIFLQRWLDDKKKTVHPMQEVSLYRNALEFYKFIHGEKKHITSENIHHVLDWSSILRDAEVEDE